MHVGQQTKKIQLSSSHISRTGTQKKKKKVRKLFTYYLKIAIINITIYRESLKQMIFI